MIDYTKKTMVKGKDDHYAKMEYNSRAISPGSVELLNLRMLQRHQHHVDAYIETRNDGLQKSHRETKSWIVGQALRTTLTAHAPRAPFIVAFPMQRTVALIRATAVCQKTIYILSREYKSTKLHPTELTPGHKLGSSVDSSPFLADGHENQTAAKIIVFNLNV